MQWHAHRCWQKARAVTPQKDVPAPVTAHATKKMTETNTQSVMPEKKASTLVRTSRAAHCARTSRTSQVTIQPL